MSSSFLSEKTSKIEKGTARNRERHKNESITYST